MSVAFLTTSSTLGLAVHVPEQEHLLDVLVLPTAIRKLAGGPGFAIPLERLKDVGCGGIRPMLCGCGALFPEGRCSAYFRSPGSPFDWLSPSGVGISALWARVRRGEEELMLQDLVS